ncbi:hypothetical protein V5F34_00980 [Xanthobacter autotrophicus]|uniref:hypothetical protein n=1 Tax=Xanthobacter autotrophicus TaxID=280 RepID=UPI00372770E1
MTEPDKITILSAENAELKKLLQQEKGKVLHEQHKVKCLHESWKGQKRRAEIAELRLQGKITPEWRAIVEGERPIEG